MIHTSQSAICLPCYRSRLICILQPIHIASVIVPQMLKLIAVAVKKSFVDTEEKRLLPHLLISNTLLDEQSMPSIG